MKRPACNRCVKAGLECKGYARQRIFVNSATPSEPPQGISRTGDLVLKSYSPKRCLLEEATSKDCIPGVMMSLEHALVRSAHEEQTISLYLDSELPFGTSCDPHTMESSSSWWTTAVYQLYVTDDALRSALLAHCLSFIGRRDGQHQMAAEGLRLYTIALRQMAMGLQDSQRANSDALLATSRFLSLYEVCRA